MNEEMELNEMEMNNDILEENDCTYDESEDSGNSILGKVLAGGLIGAIGFCAYVGALKLQEKGSKLDQWRIKKLEKKGFVVVDEDDEDSNCEDDYEKDFEVYK